MNCVMAVEVVSVLVVNVLNELILFAVKVPLNKVEYRTSLLTVSYIIRFVAVALRTGAM